jgi:hypothetical protein
MFSPAKLTIGAKICMIFTDKGWAFRLTERKIVIGDGDNLFVSMGSFRIVSTCSS